MPQVLMYCTKFCPYCVRAERLLTEKGVEIEKIFVDQNFDRFDEMMARSGGRRTVPQIFIGDQHIGGYDDLAALNRDGGLDPLLAAD